MFSLVCEATVLVFAYQEKEKTFDEVQKFYSAQAAKDKENMKQAVNYKVQWTCTFTFTLLIRKGGNHRADKNQNVVFIVVNIFFLYKLFLGSYCHFNFLFEVVLDCTILNTKKLSKQRVTVL